MDEYPPDIQVWLDTARKIFHHIIGMYACVKFIVSDIVHLLYYIPFLIYWTLRIILLGLYKNLFF